MTTTKLQQATENPAVTHEMIMKLYGQYQYDHIIAVRKASKIQRELSQAEHETARIKRHLDRIEEFCKNNGVSLESEA